MHFQKKNILNLLILIGTDHEIQMKFRGKFLKKKIIRMGTNVFELELQYSAC